jgi:hypothetical protein
MSPLALLPALYCKLKSAPGRPPESDGRRSEKAVVARAQDSLVGRRFAEFGQQVSKNKVNQNGERRRDKRERHRIARDRAHHQGLHDRREEEGSGHFLPGKDYDEKITVFSD